MTAKELKERYPIYPESIEVEVLGTYVQEAVIRINREGKWYLVLVREIFKFNTKTIGKNSLRMLHDRFHLNVYRSIHLLKWSAMALDIEGNSLFVEDDNQELEEERIEKLFYKALM